MDKTSGFELIPAATLDRMLAGEGWITRRFGTRWRVSFDFEARHFTSVEIGVVDSDEKRWQSDEYDPICDSIATRRS